MNPFLCTLTDKHVQLQCDTITWWILPLCFPAIKLNPISPNYHLMSHKATLKQINQPPTRTHTHTHTLRLWVLRPTQRWQAPYHTVSLSPKIVFSSINLAGPVCHANVALACVPLLPWQISNCVRLCRCVWDPRHSFASDFFFCAIILLPVIHAAHYIICHYLSYCRSLILLLPNRPLFVCRFQRCATAW